MQVVHDIRSPLRVIDVLAEEAMQLPEEQRIMLRNAASRINDIAGNLLNTYKSQTSEEKTAHSLPLFVFISRLFSEKQLQYAKQNIEFKMDIAEDSYFVFTLFELSSLQRILSNLINNAVEAMGDKGCITLALEISQAPKTPSSSPLSGGEPDMILLTITDNGKGIPAEVLSKLGHMGVTHRKNFGIGIGLAHAIETLEKHQGKLKIESEVGTGTTVAIELPLAEAPAWFAQSLTVATDSILIILDDDSSIHYLWDKKLAELKLPNAVHHFYFVNELDEWMTKHLALSKQVVLLCDNELIGSKLNGREVIEKYRAHVQDTLLVTSYYAFQELAEEVIRLQTRLLPKELVMQLPIAKTYTHDEAWK